MLFPVAVVNRLSAIADTGIKGQSSQRPLVKSPNTVAIAQMIRQIIITLNF